MRINYGLSTSDHMPLFLSVNIGNLPAVQSVHNSLSVGKLDWSNLTKDVELYLAPSDSMLSNTGLPKDAVSML